MVISYANQAKEKGELFITQRRGVLTILPKKNRDQTLIKNKRDICLLDIIYKIVSKAIANRLLSVIVKLVDPKQTGSMRGPYIALRVRCGI